MPKLDLTNLVPTQYNAPVFSQIIRALTGQLNPLSEGRLAARYNAQSSVPSGSVSYAVGDFVPDSNATVTGGSVRLGWICTASGTPGTFKEFRGIVADFSPITNSLSSDVSLTSTAQYFDGPSVAQGTSGTWFVSGTVTALGGGATIVGLFIKLWDGTNLISSTDIGIDNTQYKTATLSGFITNPAGNLRISVKDVTTTTSKLAFNASGNSKDCTITAVRIG